MTAPWPNGYLNSSALDDPLDNPVLQRDCARELASVLEERNEKALRLHKPTTSFVTGLSHCSRDGDPWPCRDRRALTGADEETAA